MFIGVYTSYRTKVAQKGLKGVIQSLIQIKFLHFQKGVVSMNNWFIKLGIKQEKIQIIIDESGNIYNGEKNSKLCLLTREAFNEIKNIVSENVYMIQKLGGRYDSHSNNSVLKINCNTRKYKYLEVTGWIETEKIFNIIKDKNNWKEEF